MVAHVNPGSNCKGRWNKLTRRIEGDCVGNTSPASGIGYPSLCLMDGPLGVRFLSGVTAHPAGIHAVSTWDVDLINQRGAAIGEESRDLGISE